MFRHHCQPVILFTLLVLLIASCQPASPETPGPTPPSSIVHIDEPTHTPEIFIPLTAVASPAPTVESNLPLTCQVTDLKVYVNESDGYCFAYPLHFEMDIDMAGQPLLFGPVLDDSLEPVRAMLSVVIVAVKDDAELTGLVNTFLEDDAALELPPISRQAIMFGGEPAEVVEVVPGREGSRDVFVLHGGKLFRFLFMPSVRDFPQAQTDVETLYQTVTGSFNFLH